MAPLPPPSNAGAPVHAALPLTVPVSAPFATGDTAIEGAPHPRASMVLGIDASNIRRGGGVTHLVELLRVANPAEHGFAKVVVWSGDATLSQIEDHPWLVKSHQPLLDKRLPYRVFWQRFRLTALAREAGCDVLFVLGGSHAGNFHPMVAFNQNLLPFEWRELRRYGLSWMTLKLLLLRVTQARTFQRADGLIFLTHHAYNVVMRTITPATDNTTTVAHGIDTRFAIQPREQFAITGYSPERPFRILYVSIIDVYKHQWTVAEAVVQLRATGWPVVLDLIGPAYPPALRRLRKTLRRIDPKGEVVRYAGEVPYRFLHAHYAEADLCAFASSCETFGQILTEAMSAGLPIACSNRSAMPELLGDAGTYFDPENLSDIARALRELIESPALRAAKARASFERSNAFSWKRCAEATFGFLASVATTSQPEHGSSGRKKLAARSSHGVEAHVGTGVADNAAGRRAVEPAACDVTVIVLTFNEQANIARALDSVAGWAREILILDSFSSDKTLEIAEHYPCSIYQNRFANFATQRNYALDHLPIRCEWVFFLDADEWLPSPLKHEISSVIASNPPVNGFYLKYRLIWMRAWIRRGYYPTWILRLFRRGKARCEDRALSEHLLIDGAAEYLQNDLMHEDRKGIGEWITRHNAYATREALELVEGAARKEQRIDARFWGTQAQRKRWLRHAIWNRMPPLIRPFVYFGYRYFLAGGFLDGRQAFVYHFLQALWFPMLIDIKYLETKQRRERAGRHHSVTLSPAHDEDIDETASSNAWGDPLSG